MRELALVTPGFRLFVKRNTSMINEKDRDQQRAESIVPHL